jgi:heterodisulfide reductase subunit A
MSDAANKIVFLCECGPIIRDLVDLDELGRASEAMPGVAKVERYATLCSTDGKAWMAEKLRENPDLLPVVAACSPREHAETFAAICEDAGRNPFMLSRANIREQVAWVTPDKAEATAKAVDVVAAATARVGEQEPLVAPEIDCETSVLVVGSGVAGMTAAQLLAESGRNVILVEREPAIGGKIVLLSEIYPGMECAPCLVEPLMDKVLHHPNIEVITSAEVEDVLGYLGNFTALVRKHSRHVDASGCYGCIDTCSGACPVSVSDKYNAGMTQRKAVYIPFMGALPNAAVVDETTCLHFTTGECDVCVGACPFGVLSLDGADEVVEFHVGAIVLATGSELSLHPGTAYDLPNVMTTWEFERMINPDGPTGGEVKLANGAAPTSIALIHCADESGCAPAQNCSGTCCHALAKHALEIGHKLPAADVVEFAWDRVLGGPHYRAVAASGELPTTMTMVRLVSTNKLRVEAAADNRVSVIVTMGGKTRTMEFDMVVLAPPHVGDPDAVALARRASVDVDDSGYVLTANKLLQTSTSRIEGIYVAGSAQGEKDVTAAASHATAAAGAVMSALVPGKKLIREAITASVNDTLCGGCRICTFACPYKAISFDDEQSVAVVNELLCHGCGTCSAACPSSAITARHFTDDQILAEIHTFSHNVDPQSVL